MNPLDSLHCALWGWWLGFTIGIIAGLAVGSLTIITTYITRKTHHD